MARERVLILAWLAGSLLLLGVLGVWGIGMGGAEKLVDAWGRRWVTRIERGEELLAEGRYEEAAEYLEALDHDFPARFVKHRLDRERERVLTLLGRSYVALGRKGRALDTFERLVDFDPRNWANHFELAEAARALGEPASAADAYREVVAIHPSHLPSVQALVTLAFDGGDYASVAPIYEAYLDAWLLAPMPLQLGGVNAPLEIPVDGRPHTIEVVVSHEATSEAVSACLATGGYSVAIGTLTTIPPKRVGSTDPAEVFGWPADFGWEGQEGAAVADAPWRTGEEAVFTAGDPRARVCRELRELPGGLARVRLELTAFKALPAELWAMVEKSYENTLAHDTLAAVRERSLVGGCLEAGSLFED